MRDYGLIHIVTGGEFRTPLVASQSYDQAENQDTSKSLYKPRKVEVWCIEPMRVALNKKTKMYLKGLRKRFPSINIRCFGGVNRLDDFPLYQSLTYYRKKIYGKIPVIYHCRGESSLIKIARLKEKFPQDLLHLDVRGHWPSESLYRQGIELNHTEDFANNYFGTSNDERLKRAISIADSVNTVSENLKNLLVKYYHAPDTTYIVPNCINTLIDRSSREMIRRKWRVKDDEKMIVYSGGTAGYQHLEDLVIPFLKSLVEHHNLRAVFLSHEIETIRRTVKNMGIPNSKVIFESLPQEKVGQHLAACDAGLMIRKPTLVNQVANPAKIAEYLGAGLPIILQKGIGGVENYIRDFGAGIIVDLYINEEFIDETDRINEWLQNSNNYSKNALRLAGDKFLWKNAIQLHRKNYYRILQNKNM